jgi:hypothetical protein
MSLLRRQVCQRVLAQDHPGTRKMRSASLPFEGSTDAPSFQWTRTEVEGIEVRSVLEVDGTVHRHLRVCVDTLDWGEYCKVVHRYIAHLDRVATSFGENTNSALADGVFDQLSDFNFDVFLHMRILEAVARIKFQKSHRHRNSLVLLPYTRRVGAVTVAFGVCQPKPL